MFLWGNVVENWMLPIQILAATASDNLSDIAECKLYILETLSRTLVWSIYPGPAISKGPSSTFNFFNIFRRFNFLSRGDLNFNIPVTTLQNPTC